MVRVSGPDVPVIASRLLRTASLDARQAVLTHVVDPDDGSIVDEVVATLYRAPNSFTGEDLLEIHSDEAAVEEGNLPITPDLSVDTLLKRFGIK